MTGVHAASAEVHTCVHTRNMGDHVRTCPGTVTQIKMK